MLYRGDVGQSVKPGDNSVEYWNNHGEDIVMDQATVKVVRGAQCNDILWKFSQQHFLTDWLRVRREIEVSRSIPSVLILGILGK